MLFVCELCMNLCFALVDNLPLCALHLCTVCWFIANLTAPPRAAQRLNALGTYQARIELAESGDSHEQYFIGLADLLLCPADELV